MECALCARGVPGSFVLGLLLHPPLHLAGLSIGMGRECQQNDSLASPNVRPCEFSTAVPAGSREAWSEMRR